MAQLIFQPIRDRIESGTYLLYDGAIGTGGMLTIAEQTLQGIAEEHGKRVSTHLYGQEVNNETYAICKADMLLKGERKVYDNILGDPQHSTLSNDAFRPPRFATGSYIQFEDQHNEVDQTARNSISQLRGRWIR